MFKKAFLTFLLAFFAGSAGADVAHFPAAGGGTGFDGTAIRANLPTCDATTNGQVYKVTDCLAEDSCATGGGIHVELMICDNGDDWQLAGDGTDATGADSITVDGAAVTTTGNFLSGAMVDPIRCTALDTPHPECAAAEDIVFDIGGVLDWDPAAASTTTAGLAEAIAECDTTNGGECTIRQRPDTTYTITHDFLAAGDGQVAVDIEDTTTADDTDNILIQCDPSSKIIFSGSTGAQASPIFIRVQNTKKFRIDSCNIEWTETCAASCGSGGNGVLVNIGENVQEYEITNNRIEVSEPASTDAYKNYRAILVGPNLDGEAGMGLISGNQIVTSSRGISMKGLTTAQNAHIDTAIVSNNNVSFRGYGSCSTTTATECLTAGHCPSGETCNNGPGRPVNDTGSDDMAGAFGFVNRGGATFVGNTCDARGDWVVAGGTNVITCYGGNFNDDTATNANRAFGGVFNGNMAVGLTTEMVGLELEGASGFTVSNNYFEAGQCSATTGTGCRRDDDCPVSGSETCTTSFPLGIYLDANTNSNSDFNRGNSITGNVFGHSALPFGDNGSTTAAIRIEDPDGTDVNENADNVISNNVITVDNTSTDDGFQISDAAYKLNTVTNNVVVGIRQGYSHSFGPLSVEETDNWTATECTAHGGSFIYPDTSEGKWKKCTSGTLTDLDTTGSGAFTDAEPIIQNTRGNNVEFGDAGVALTGKVEIGGDDDQPQFVVEAHITQTDSVLIIQQDDETQVVNIESDGDILSQSIQDIDGPGTNWQIDSAGDATFNSITTGASATPAVDFDDSDDTGTIEGSINVDCPTADNCDMEFAVNSGADTETTFLKLDTASGATVIEMGLEGGGNLVSISEGGVVSFSGTADIDLPNASVDEDDISATLAFDDGDLLNFNAVSVTGTGEGIQLPVHATDCSTLGTDEGQVCWEADADALYIGTGAAVQLVGGAASGDVTDVGDCGTGACFTGASGTLLQSNTDLIMELDNDNDGTESFQVKDGADTMVAEIAESGVINTLVGLDAIGAVDMDYGSADVTDHTFTTDGTGTAEVVLPAGSIDSTEILNDTVAAADLADADYGVFSMSSDVASLDRLIKSMYWGAGSMSTDGTNCAAPAEVTINSGPKLYSVICTDNDGSTLYGSTVMPDAWSSPFTVTFELNYVQTAADTSALNGDISAQCRGNGETPSGTWGTEVAIDDAALVGSNANDQATSAAVTPAGTCAAGDTLYWRWQMDATGTTTAAATLNFIGMKMEYGWTGGTSGDN